MIPIYGVVGTRRGIMRPTTPREKAISLDLPRYMPAAMRIAAHEINPKKTEKMNVELRTLFASENRFSARYAALYLITPDCSDISSLSTPKSKDQARTYTP
jgi:hypothetical protein